MARASQCRSDWFLVQPSAQTTASQRQSQSHSIVLEFEGASGSVHSVSHLKGTRRTRAKYSERGLCCQRESYSQRQRRQAPIASVSKCSKQAGSGGWVLRHQGAFCKGFPCFLSQGKHRRRKALPLQATADASEETSSTQNDKLLPDTTLAKLRQKGVTVWEFYYDTSDDIFGLGNVGEEVRALQGYLALTGHFQSEHGMTGYFGPDTQRALSDWQRQHGVEPAIGMWGPYSRDKYRQLVAEEAGRSGLLEDRPTAREPMRGPSVRTAERPAASKPTTSNEASTTILHAPPPTPSVSVSVPVTPPSASRATGGLSLSQSLIVAVVVLAGAVLIGILLRKKPTPKVPSALQLESEEMDRTRNMLELDRKGGPQPKRSKPGG